MYRNSTVAVLWRGSTQLPFQSFPKVGQRLHCTDSLAVACLLEIYYLEVKGEYVSWRLLFTTSAHEPRGGHIWFFSSNYSRGGRVRPPQSGVGCDQCVSLSSLWLSDCEAAAPLVGLILYWSFGRCSWTLRLGSIFVHPPSGSGTAQNI